MILNSESIWIDLPSLQIPTQWKTFNKLYIYFFYHYTLILFTTVKSASKSAAFNFRRKRFRSNPYQKPGISRRRILSAARRKGGAARLTFIEIFPEEQLHQIYHTFITTQVTRMDKLELVLGELFGRVAPRSVTSKAR